MVRVQTLLCVALVVGIIAGRTQAADNWPNWRGPDGNGVAPSGDYPISWGPEENLRWSVPMPGHAGSTPIVWNDQIFVTSTKDGQNVALCFNWDGKLQWEVALGDERPGKHKKASGSNSSPVTDGQRVFTYFKSGDLAGLDLDGSVLWKRNLQDELAEDTLWWDLGTSPVLTRDHVVVACVQSGPSYLAAFEKQTGELAWKVDRILDAPEEANQTYATPLVIEHGGEQMLVVLGADHVTAHSARDGKELWRLGGFNPEQNGYFRSIASPVECDGIIVAPYARGTTLTAISLDGKLLWRDDTISSDVPTPAAIDGKVYVCSDKGRLACLDLKTGRELWSVETGKNRNVFSSSPILAGKHAYLTREDGTVFVVDTTEGHQAVAAVNEMKDFTVATPVFAKGKILLRTAGHLFCIGQSD